MTVKDLRKRYNSNKAANDTLINILIAKAEQEEQCRDTLYANFVPDHHLGISTQQADSWSTHRLMYEILGKIWNIKGLQ